MVWASEYLEHDSLMNMLLLLLLDAVVVAAVGVVVGVVVVAAIRFLNFILKLVKKNRWSKN